MNENAQTKILRLLHRGAQLMHRGRRHAGMPHGAGHHGQMRLLWLLSRMDGASQSELCEELDVRPASLSELIDRLEQGGLVERRQNENDRRSAHVFMTDTGRDAAKQAEAARKGMMRDIFANLDDDECARLAELLEKLVSGIAPEGEEDEREFGRGRHPDWRRGRHAGPHHRHRHEM